jgi:phospholipase C
VVGKDLSNPIPEWAEHGADRKVVTFTGEMGRQPTYEEYAHIMTGFTPEQVPVLSAIARDFGVFDHWFCEVPSQTFMNRSFWMAWTSSGLVVNSPVLEQVSIAA